MYLLFFELVEVLWSGRRLNEIKTKGSMAEKKATRIQDEDYSVYLNIIALLGALNDVLASELSM